MEKKSILSHFKNILMVAPEPIFQPRGTPFSVVGRLKALSDMGYHVDLLTYPFGEDVDIPNVRIIRIPSVRGIKQIKIGPSLAKIPLDFLLFLYTIRQLISNRYELLHTHEEAGFWGILLSRIFNVPHIYDMHSSLPQQLHNFQFTKSRFVYCLFRSMEHWILKYSSAVITICPDLRDHVADIHPDRGSILIENVIDYKTVFGETNHPVVKKSQFISGNKKIALYAGTFESYQGLDLLIQSAKIVSTQNKQIHFLMVGGHSDQVSCYKQMVEDADLNHIFSFTGQVPPEHVPDYIQIADILLSPRNAGTNTPLKIYSYLRSMRPIIATRLLTHTQVLSDHTAILTEVSPESFADGISKAINDQKYVSMITKNAAQLAEKEYSYPVYLKKFKQTISLALQRGIS